MELWFVISAAILSISIIILAILLTPKKRKPPPRRQVKKPAPLPQAVKQTVKPPEPQAPGKMQNLIATEKKKRKREETRKWVGENPVIATRIIRCWLNQRKKRI